MDIGVGRGSGRPTCRVGSRNLNIFIHVFRKLLNFAGTENLQGEFDYLVSGSGRVEIL
jgi:hypothetical protein